MGTASLQLVVAGMLWVMCWSGQNANGQSIQLTPMNGVITTYDNNSIVNRTDIGTGAAALLCTTTYSPCCTSANSDTHWYFPNGSQVPNSQAGVLPYYRSRSTSPRAVRLNRNSDGTTTGIFRCDIPDASGVTRSMFVGIYDNGTGMPTATTLVYSETTRSLTCTSTGGPATTVTWRKDGVIITVNTTYLQTQMVTDTTTGKYETVLTIAQSVNDVFGTYSCTVGNTRGTSAAIEATVSSLQVVITPGASPTAGQSYTFTCTVTLLGGLTGTPTVQWSGPGGSITTGGDFTLSSTPSHTLTINPLRQSQDGLYTCQATLGSTTGSLSAALTVGAPSVSVLITPTPAGTAIAGQSYSLSCSVSGADSLNPTSTTYRWYNESTNPRSQVGTANVYTINTVGPYHAGQYTCEVMIASPYLNGDLSRSMMQDITVQIPDPAVNVVPAAAVSALAGSELTLRCGIVLDFTLLDIIGGLHVTSVWTGPGSGMLSSDGRITVSPASLVSMSTTFLSTVVFDTLRTSDNGTYNCQATVAPRGSTAGTVMNGVRLASGPTLSIANPAIQLVLSTNANRLPNMAPYNTFSLSCTATIPEGVTISKTFTWTKRIESSTSVFDVLSANGDSILITSTNLDQPTSTSVLTVRETTAGDYRYRCRADLSDLSIMNTMDVYPINVTGPTSPVQPQNLMNVVTLHDRATVQWSVSYIAYTPESYTVKYGLAMGSLNMSVTATQMGDNFIIPSQPFTFSAILTELSPGVTYYYQVEARNSEGTTPSTVQQFTSAEQPPTPPQMFQITAVSTNSLSFSWQEPATPNGDITKYEISCKPLLLGIPMPQNHSTENTTRMTVLTDLLPGVRYNCSIGARNSAGLSNVVYADNTTTEIAPTGPPLSFRAITLRARNITFSWAPPNAADRNGVITNYSLSCVPQTSGGSSTYTEAGTFTVEGFMPATSYNCSIFASNCQGNGPATSVNPRTLEDSPDAAPQSVMFEYDQDSPEIVLFSWQPLPPNQQNGVITGYNITCASSSGELVNGVSGGALNATLGMFTPATQYSCNITASTSAGTGPVNTVSLLTLPVAPENVTLTVNPTGSTSRLLVSWTIDPGVISHYTIYVTRLERGNTVLPPYTSTVTQFGIPRGDLDPGEGVSVNVSASNSAGEGARSPGVRERTGEERPGSVGCQSRWTDLTTIPAAIQVNWTAPQEPNGIILRYYLILTSYDGNTVIDTMNVNTSVTLVTTFDATLDDGVPYTVEILAENSAGNGSACNVTDFTNELQSPVPSDVSVTRLNGTVLRVTWQRLSLVEARGHITYRVMVTSTSANKRKRQTTPGERMCTLMSAPCEVPANESSVLVGGLDPDTSYRVTVTTVNSEDEVGPTSEAVIAPALPTPSSNTLPIIIGAAVAAVLIVLIIVIIIVIALVVWWKRSQTKRVRLPSPPPSFDMKVSSVEEGATLDQSASKGFMHSESDLATAEPLETVPTTGSMEDQVIDRLRPIAVASFASHVLDMHHDRDKGFELEYQSVGNEHLAAYEVAKLSYNKTKNRFANIFPYDFSRVKLQEIKGVEGSEYVNASYIDGYNHPNAYIAAQGPMPNTCSDFWRMIWEQKLVTVVMLTKCTEAGKRKCEQYWPDNVNENFDAGSNLLVTLTELIPFADYEIKRFSIQDTSKPDTPALSVTHYHFLGWPDHGVPKFATSLIAFIRRVRKNHNKDGPPMLVHCSAGVGRTGTFILLDSMLERMKVEKTVNVYEFLRNMRAKRVFMVQTLAQYVFIHDALEELITCGETDISATNLRVKVNKLHKIIPEKAISGFEDQFRLLDKVSRKPNDSDCSDALQHYNRSKNRYPDRVPYNLSRARLRPTGVTGAEYVNASFVDGYKQRNAYLATQAPLKETVNDFWRMVWEFKSKAIMMLCNTEENGQEASFPFWPTRLQEPETYGKLLLTLQVEEPCKEYTVRKFEIKEEKPQNPNQNQHPSFVVTLFHYKEWPEHDRPRSTSSILQLVEQVNKVQRSTGNRVITIMCNDGMGRTGTFLCIHAQLERVKSEGLVDFFQFVKSSRIHRPSIVSELEHYIFCHDTLADFLDSFDTYANFKDLGDGQR